MIAQVILSIVAGRSKVGPRPVGRPGRTNPSQQMVLPAADCYRPGSWIYLYEARVGNVPEEGPVLPPPQPPRLFQDIPSDYPRF